MPLFRRKKKESPPSEEHLVYTMLVLEGEDYGTEDERAAIKQMEREMGVALKAAGVGEHDGDEWGNGTVTLWSYGGNADEVFAVIEPILRRYPARQGSWVEKRYGPASDLNRREECVYLWGR